MNYDAMGNITYYKLGNQALTYYYNASKQLDYVTGSKSYYFSYDDKGKVTDNGKRGFVYNTADQLVESDGYSYTYDGNNKRVKEVGSTGISYSFYASNGKLMYRLVNGDHVDYYYLGGKLIAKKKGATVSYLHADYLGSTAAESTTSGVVTSRMHYQPFGESIEATKDDVGYTGHKFDTDLGLSYMQARYYDPVIGRFYSNDPKDAALFLAEGKIQGFNRYVYAANNPYKYVDPDGKDYEETFISVKIPFVGALDVGKVNFTPNSRGEGSKTSGAFVRVSTSASNVDSGASNGKISQKGAVAGLTFGKGAGTHTDQNFDDPSATVDIGLGVATVSIGDISGGESSATVEIGPSIGADATVSKSFTLTGQDIKNAASTAVDKVKEIFED